MKGMAHQMAEELRWESGQVVGELDIVFRISTEEKWASGVCGLSSRAWIWAFESVVCVRNFCAIGPSW